MVSKSRKHARTVKLNSAVNNAIEKAVDAHKVAAFTIGAAGVLAGAAFAFGATPAMAAETGATAKTNPVPVTAGEKPGVDKKAEAGKNNQADGKSATDEKTDNNTLKNAHKTKDNKSKFEQNLSKEKKASTQSVVNADGQADVTKTETGSKVESIASVDNQDAKQDSEEIGTPAGSVVNKRTRRSLDEKKQAEPTKDAQAENQDRASDGTASQDSNKIKPDTKDTTNTKISIDENNAETMPNMYGWGSSDNTYSVDGEKHTVTFNFAKPTDGGKITNIAIFPAQNNGLTNDKSKRGAEYYSGDPKMHQSFSGNYKFNQNDDGSATLTMSNLFRDGNLNGGAEAYAANRSIFVYVTKDGTTTVYKTNAFRAATLVPPKTAGSVVLKYNQELTPEKVQAAITAAANAETARKDKKSVNDQLTAASTSKGVFTRENGKAVQVADTTDGKLNVKSSDAYDKDTFNAINTKKTGDTNSYVAGAKTLNTYMVTDLGFKSGAIPLTVARYDTRIEKPIVEDPTKLSQEVKEDIAKKLAKINGVTADKISFEGDKAVIHFDGVDENDAPKIKLSDLVLKKLKDGEYKVPTGSEAVFVANPLGYSKAEIERIKQAIFDANKENKDLGLTSKDQITLSYITGDTTVGHENIGISNGQAENTITVKIKTDKAVAEFTSDIKANKLTKLPNIRTDYDVTWTNTKIDGRDTDEGISWSNDQKTTIIYRYDPTKAQEFDTTKILGLLTATPKDNKSGLRTLNGGELLSYEGTGNNARKSHMHYALQGSEPTGELTLGNMGGAYWSGNQKVSNSDVDLGDNLSIAGSYSWDPEAGPVTVAGKKDKIFKARLFVEPYAMTYYKDVYLEKNRHPGNTAKAINVIFVPQTNHKTSDLKTSVEEHKTVAVDGNEVPTQSAYYNASDKVKSDYDDALKVAKALYDQVKDTKESDLTEKQKADIDNATIKLDKARAALDGANTDKDKLNASIEANGKAAAGSTAEKPGTVTTDRYKNVTEPDFKTPDGKTDTKKNEDAKAAKKAYDEALEKAKTVTADDNATQKAVDEAKAKLDAAREKLNEFTTNKDELNNAIAQHGKVNTGDAKKTDPAEKLKTADPTYQNSTPEQRKAYDDAVAEADKVSKDPNASQKEVNEAIKKLKEAKDALDKNATDKAPLDAAVQKSFDNPDPKDDSKQSVFYKNAAAKKDTDPAAKKAVEDYDKALQKAKDVLADENATKKDVEDAKKALEDAEAALHADKYQTKATDLAEAIADNVSGYLMPAYFNAFDLAQSKDPADAEKAKQAAEDFKAYNDAYHAAKDLLKDIKKPNSAVTQDQANEVKNKLIEARKAIDKYATDTSKISAALLHSLAITKSPAYLNASAGAEGSDEAKAKKAYDDALKELQKAFNDQMDKDKGDDGNEIPESVIPDKTIDMTNADALKKLQAHAKGQPLNRDVTKLLAKLNDAVKGLDKFATKTDELLKSVNEHDNTQKTPAYKNASVPDFKNDDGTENTTKKDAAKKAVDEYGAALNTAKDLLKNPAATQKEVNDAKDKLDKARKELEKYNTDTTKLKESVKKHGDTEGTAPTEGTQTSDAYRNASDPHFMKEEGGKLVPDTDKNTQAAAAKKAYDEALTKAQELLKKHGDANTPQDAKPTQTDINKALDALDTARTNLDTYKTDTSKLSEESNKSTADGAAQPTAGSFENSPEFKNADADTSEDAKADVKAYKEALKTARDLVKAATETGKKNSERPTQQQINEALEALKNAKKQITDNYKTNAAALKAAKDFAAGDFKNTPEYKNAKALKDNQNADADKKSKAKTDVDALDKDTNDGALNKAIGILQAFDDDGKPNVTTGARIPTQKEVDDALKTLQEAMKTVAEGYKTDVKPLSNEVGDKDKDGNPVTPKFEESIPYKNALEKKNAGDTDATSKLKDYNDKLAAAQKIIDQVNKPDPNAKPEDRPTQKQVNDALKALQDAKKAIDDSFGTKIDDLKTEAAKSTADGGTVADADFEATTEYKNADYKKTDDGKDNADVTVYKEALSKARTLINKFDENGKPKPGEKDIPSQKEVDEALKNLKEIKDKITKNYVTSPHDLQQEVDKSKDGDTDTDTSPDVFENTPAFKNATAKGDDASKQALKDYNEKLTAAKTLLDKFDRTTGKPKKDAKDVPTQKQLDDALDALKAAKKKITDGYKTDSSKLKSEADANDTFTKTPEYVNAQAKGDDASKQALEAYKKALEDANKVLGDKNATQAQVDAALKKLQDAKSKLSDGYKTNKSDLRQEAGDDFTKSPEYQNAQAKGDDESKKALEDYKKALDEANSVLKDPNATQAEVDAALKKLQGAKSKLRDENGTDKSKLQTEADDDAKFRKSLYFIIGNKDDIEAYNTALAEAKRVLNDPNATQAQVDEALRKLQAAKYKLNHPFGAGSGSGIGSGYDPNAGNGFAVETSASQSASVDKTALQVEVNNAVNTNANTAAARAYRQALAEAKRVLADKNATQAQVDEALRNLKNAKSALLNSLRGASGNAGGLANTGAETGLFASIAAIFAGFGVAGVASRRRKHSNE